MVRQFWTAVLDNDRQTLAAVARFPFTWDARCRVLTSIEQIHHQLDEQLRKQPSPAPKVSIGEILEADASTANLPAQVMRSLSKLIDSTADCGAAEDALLAQAATYNRRYFIVDLLVDGKHVLTATRTSLVNQGWFVTGFDN